LGRGKIHFFMVNAFRGDCSALLRFVEWQTFNSCIMFLNVGGKMDTLNKAGASGDVGTHLKRLREERKISLRTLARQSGLSANALSMVERGLTSPSVSTLNKVAAALEVPITAFFRGKPERQNIIFRQANMRHHIPSLSGLWEDLSDDSFTENMEAFALTLEKGSGSGSHSINHTGGEFVYILNGQLNCEIDGQQICMETGDSLLFSAKLIHRWYNPGPTVTTAIILIAAFDNGERPVEYHLAVRDQAAGSEQNGII
ncbi:MAG TPA: helix-turn-helix domain-containing protein, partial [Anaerolineaceae bacterium]